MTLTVLVQQQTQVCAFTISGRQHPQEGWPIAIDNKQRSKRDIPWHELYLRDMSASPVVWVNPCNVSYSGENSSEDRRVPVQLILRPLLNSVKKMRTLLPNVSSSISIRNMSQFSKFHEIYKFLPVVKSNSTVTLRRWHRDLQWFIGFFSYFYRAELHWDYHELQHKSADATELEFLRNHARSILCEIEAAINITAAHHRRPQHDIRYISRAVMQRRLRKFNTSLEHIHTHTGHQVTGHHQQSIQVNMLDLKFLKYRYFRFLRSILKALRQNTRRRGVFMLDSHSSSSSSSAQASASSLASLSSASELSSSSSQQIDPLLLNTSNNSHGNGNSHELALPSRPSSSPSLGANTKRPRNQQRRKRKKLRHAVHYFF